jgi:hypothetical protein
MIAQSWIYKSASSSSIGRYMCRMYTVYSQRGQYKWQPDHILLPAPIYDFQASADVSEDTQYTVLRSRDKPGRSYHLASRLGCK